LKDLLREPNAKELPKVTLEQEKELWEEEVRVEVEVRDFVWKDFAQEL
jgi:hypothetical protein